MQIIALCRGFFLFVFYPLISSIISMITNLLIISDEIHLRTGAYFVKFILTILQVAWVLAALRLTNHIHMYAHRTLFTCRLPATRMI